ncbi:hypothetical protein F5Y10DRAFT_271364 [Nemania abortiva]|nr:hypothetical protein F5Y10DRAFT_271364 [Nemania abortiva]
MDPKSDDSRGGGPRSFKTAQQSLEANLKTMKSEFDTQSNTAQKGSPTPMTPTANLGGTDLGTTPKSSPRVAGPSQQAKGDDSKPEWEKHWSEFVPSQPIDIPGAAKRKKEKEEGLGYGDRLTDMPYTGPLFEEHGLGVIRPIRVSDIMTAEEFMAALDNHAARLLQSMKDKKREPGPIKRMINVISKVGRAKGASTGSDSDDSLAPKEDVRVGNAIMVGKNSDKFEWKELMKKPYAHQYGYTNAGAAYEEGRKSGAFKEGYHAGMANIRYRREFQLGYDQAIRAYGSPPKPHQPRTSSSSQQKQVTRSPIVKKDGSLALYGQLLEEVRTMMDNLGVPRADFDDDSQDKGKGKERPRTAFEVSEFLKDLAYALRHDTPY